MEKSKNPQYVIMITPKLIEKDMNRYENHRSYTFANSTNVDTTDTINDILRRHKAAWDALAR
jgi:hypothetical protein